ncbi:MAG: radical SAM protein [Desulfacinum sp.]|jgi:uncharacterized protein|nr:radical SAM protein [Desulfacinum sp.]MBZ4658091.1 radical protein [Desulfacinum sp.]
MNIRYLILALTTRCNLRCRYCYHGDALAREDMPPEVIRRAVGLAVSGGSPFHLQLTGGEPTLVPELVEVSADLGRSTGRCLRIGLQTNGTGLTPQMIEIIKRYNLQVGVSLDGPPAVHQAARGLAAETLRGLQSLETARIPFGVTTVVSRINAGQLDKLVLVLSGFSMARGIGLDLLVRKGRAQDGKGADSVDRWTLEKALRRMGATLEAVNAHRSVPIRWREWDLLFASGHRPGNRWAFCHAALGRSLAVTPDGRLFPCTQTLYDPRFAAGTVWAPQGQALSGLATCRPRPEVCAACEIHAVCPGECPSRLHYNRNGDPFLVCHLYRTLYRMGRERPNGPEERGSLP